MARSDKKKARLSGAVAFEMAAEPTGIRRGFCRWVLALAVISSLDQLNNSRSKRCTSTEMNLDDGSRMEPCGFAGLAGYSLRMRPYKMYETGTHCSVADHFQVMNEPNDVPKLGFQVLANRQIDIMHFKHRTGGRDGTLVAGSWLRSFPCCSNRVCSRNDDVHYHSGNFDSALMQQQFSGEMSVAGVTRNYFQCNTGNFHVDKFHGSATTIFAIFRAVLAISKRTIFSAILATSTMQFW